MFVVYLRDTPSVKKSSIYEDENIIHNSDSGLTEDILDTSQLNYVKPERINSDSEVASYTCELCKESFTEKFKLQKHYEIHIDTFPYKCNECSKTFSDESLLLSHSCNSNIKLVVDNFSDVDSNGDKHLEKRNSRSVKKKPFFCKKCHRRFMWAHNLKRHRALNKCLKYLTCSVCEITFSNKSKLIEHEKTHPELFDVESGEKNGRPHVCNVCGRSFRKYYYLKIHIPVHTGERAFICGACGCRFKAKRTLRVHYRRWHIATRPFACNICKKGFLSKKELVTHTYTHTASKPFRCKACGKGFCHKKSFTRHIPRCLSNDSQIVKYSYAESDCVSEDEKVVDLAYVNGLDTSVIKPEIEETNEPFPIEAVQGDVLVRMSEVKPGELDKRYQCNLCIKRFQWKKDLQRHSYSHAPQLILVCHPCRKNFQSESEFQAHKCRNRSKKNYSCETCGKSFQQRNKFKEHCSLHSDCDNALFSCDVCSMSFRSRDGLKSHRLIHAGIKNFSCKTCGKGFYVERNMISHMKVHQREQLRSSGEWEKFREAPKSHICDQCDKTFAKISDLKKHYLIHTEQIYICTMCRKIFQSELTLNTHLRSHMVELTFNCRLCEKGFCSQNDLDLHYGSHVEKKPYVCNICCKIFNEELSLLNHSCHTGASSTIYPE